MGGDEERKGSSLRSRTEMMSIHSRGRTSIARLACEESMLLVCVRQHGSLRSWRVYCSLRSRRENDVDPLARENKYCSLRSPEESMLLVCVRQHGSLRSWRVYCSLRSRREITARFTRGEYPAHSARGRQYSSLTLRERVLALLGKTEGMIARCARGEYIARFARGRHDCSPRSLDSPSWPRSPLPTSPPWPYHSASSSSKESLGRRRARRWRWMLREPLLKGRC